MDKKKLVKSLQLDEGDKYVFQYNNTIYRVEYSSEIYFLEKRISGKWTIVTTQSNKMKLIPFIK